MDRRSRKVVFIGTHVPGYLYRRIVECSSRLYGQADVARFVKEAVVEKLEKLRGSGSSVDTVVREVCRYHQFQDCLPVSTVRDLAHRFGVDVDLLLSRLKRFMYEMYSGSAYLCFRRDAEKVCGLYEYGRARGGVQGKVERSGKVGKERETEKEKERETEREK